MVALLVLALARPAVSQESQNIVIHIGQYSNDLHATAMGLGLATILVDRGAEVTVFLDREGVRLIDSDQPVLVYGDSDTGALLREFIEGGGKIIVCPHCAMLAGVDKTEMRDGVEMGTKETIGDLFLKADKVIDF
jgi:predicted peroxiredoxin